MYDRDAAIAARASASEYRGPDVATTRTLVRSADGNTGLGSEDSNPGLQDQNLACNAGYTTPHRARERSRLLLVLVRLRVVLGRVDLVGLPVDAVRPVVLGDSLRIDLR